MTMSKAAATKQAILAKSLELIYRKGYHGTSIDDIIKTINVTKGAFFYHFKSKEEMGLAIINEIFYPQVMDGLGRPLSQGEDVTEGIYKMLHTLLFDDSVFRVEYGCPVVNLVEEMSPVSEAFRKALGRLMQRVAEALESALLGAQKNGQIRADVDTKGVATFILTGYSGVRNLGKVLGRTAYTGFLKEMKTYLSRLK
ncbi:TetR/AcrR family transcriptional regulator [Pedobacter deserti]|uniref:TetR/AcrR family transcriptional regulator n=1 Tax=Pedobacter deserti TaxID=2817382 RepID=UPI00210D18E4|nr:TetR/AcrR family transcriptional regulator [Pedobacter sp. SYSU D00382]